ncbi:hypothetical protein FH609_024780 [Streptomyces sp. 3MP-14]|uniref:Uncharacterized protein n=1 Tax=Streptomyces mimosae TaxID=2586635 RepID=A0A5N6A089_9ACTN|nr:MULTISPECIES: SUKH-4 family immunity protein [Streptomyces]KAB8162164.1 hypothetical protein FH607_021955 [Streptomyces mimosae]KAB8173938.1 hypothetical protein FH609_024780 [Streptomyces sp. 3MP-14]
MSFVVSRGELAASFGADRLVTVPDERLNPRVVHPLSRRFLSEVGLPALPDFVYDPMDNLAEGLPSAVDTQNNLHTFDNLPETVDSWVRLGLFHHEPVFLDGTTGALWELLGVAQVNSRIDRFARCLQALHRHRRGYARWSPSRVREATTDRLMAEFAAVDPEATTRPECYWNGALADREWS